MKLPLASVLVIILIFTFTSGCINADETIASEDKVSQNYSQNEKADFGQHYNSESSNIKLQAAQYNLPLEISDISNYNDFSSVVQLNEKEQNKLEKNGFVVITNPFNQNEEIITDVYGQLENNDIPIFITSDSLLHVYHIQFDETLRQIEENTFYDALWELNQNLLNESLKTY